ncbi:hypothetical protein Pan216_15400 [Planctomycetes bacterium Pan216]|uniref:Uncharacterized protein n=1 Tax=Kolteria novifilia TaxID=2527975 RepID=A0A518B132_9BACT|nr:hypothetical protein Pan216_15400 [Planctomycetes bacterium Pan216]
MGKDIDLVSVLIGISVFVIVLGLFFPRSKRKRSGLPFFSDGDDSDGGGWFFGDSGSDGGDSGGGDGD